MVEISGVDQDQPYTEYGDRELIPGPFSCSGGQFRSFVLKVDHDALRELVTKVLTANDQRRREFHPISDRVLLNVSYTAKMRSSAPAGELPLHGYINEFQASVSVPVVSGGRLQGVYKHHGVMMMCPYIVVDNPISLCGGREIYGYPKSLGQFLLGGTVPLDTGNDPPEDWRDKPLTVNVFGGPDEVESRARWTPFIELTPPQERVAHQERWKAIEEVVQHFLPERLHENGLKIAAELPGVPVTFFGASLRTDTHYAFLKQFRSHNDADAACYRKVIQAPLKFEEVRGGPSEEWTVTLHKLDSHPILDDLGLKPDSGEKSVRQRVQSILLNMDYDLGTDRA
jgi:hypothetical protein